MQCKEECSDYICEMPVCQGKNPLSDVYFHFLSRTFFFLHGIRQKSRPPFSGRPALRLLERDGFRPLHQPRTSLPVALRAKGSLRNSTRVIRLYRGRVRFTSVMWARTAS